MTLKEDRPAAFFASHRSACDLTSHFLPKTPLLALFEPFPKDALPSPASHYVHLHEYLHYEDFLVWPALALRYFGEAVDAVKAIDRHRRNSRWTGFGFPKSLHWPSARMTSSGWDPSVCASKQNRSFLIGLDALIEAHAMLVFYVKPKLNPLWDVSLRTLGEMLWHRHVYRRQPHLIGVESTLAVFGLGVDSLDVPASADLCRLAAELPKACVCFPFAIAYMQAGLDPKNSTFADIMKFTSSSVSAFDSLADDYVLNLDVTLRRVYVEREMQAKFQCLSEPFHSFSRACFHAYISYCYGALWHNIQRTGWIYHYEAYLIFALLNLIRHYEAVMERSLRAHATPIVKPLWPPVPTILFNEKMFTSTRIETRDAPAGWFRLRWGHTIADAREADAWFNWFCFACMHGLADAIGNKVGAVRCPLYLWVEERYAELGSSDESTVNEHVRQMCYPVLMRDSNWQPVEGHIEPSKDKCCFPLDGKPHIDRCQCLFGHAVQAALFEKPQRPVT